MILSLTKKSYPAALDRTAALLNAGGVAVIPTDTVYGLAAHPDFPDAVARLVSIKARNAQKPIALLAADEASVRRFGADVSLQASLLMRAFWPGALTLVLPCPDGTREGFRVPDMTFTRELLARCGGVLRVTSANLSGAQPACSAVAALADVGLKADLVADGGISPGGIASTVVTFQGHAPVFLREGGISRDRILEALQERQIT